MAVGVSYDDLSEFTITKASDVIEKAMMIRNPMGGSTSKSKKNQKNTKEKPLVNDSSQYLNMIAREKINRGKKNG